MIENEEWFFFATAKIPANCNYTSEQFVPFAAKQINFN